jgi:hypothetical protein
MSGDVHVRFCESRGVRLPPATHLVVLLTGIRDHVEALRDEVAAVLAPMGLRLSEEKTVITHIDEGFDFLGFHIQRKLKQGTQRRTLYTYPSKTSLAGADAGQHEPDPRQPPATAEPGAARLGQLLPARRVGDGPSTTSTPGVGGGWSTGSVISIAVPTGSGSGGATCQGGDRRTAG